MKRMKEIAKMAEVTGKPLISERARSMNRDMGDLFKWQKESQSKKDDLKRLKD